MNRFKDESLSLIRESGCKMIFFGAESGNDKVLHPLNKDGAEVVPVSQKREEISN